MGAVSAALSLAAGGQLAVLAAAVAPVAESGGNLAPWLTGGGSAAAVAGLVYVARMVVKGDLVPRPVEEREKASAARKDELIALAKQLAELAHEAHARETVLANLGGEAVRALTLAQETNRQTNEQLSWWRDQRDRAQRRQEGRT